MKTFLNKIIFLILPLTAVILQCCSETTEPNTKDYSKEIIPLAVGHKWDYHTDIYDTSGNIYWNFNSSDIIIGDSVIENTKWFYFDKSALYFSNLSDGYHFFNMYETDSLRNYLVFKFPCNLSDVYSYYKIANVDTQITVPAGTFNCILYSYRMQTSMDFAYLDYFIRPGVGIVKTIEYSFTNNHPLFINRIEELLGYKFQ